MRNNRIDDLNKHCLEQFRNHWKCLDNHNHQLWQCRPFEWKLNKCAYDNLVCSTLHRICPGPPAVRPRQSRRETDQGPRARNSRRRSPTSPPTSRLSSCGRSRFWLIESSAPLRASPSWRARATPRRSNERLGWTLWSEGMSGDTCVHCVVESRSFNPYSHRFAERRHLR